MKLISPIIATYIINCYATPSKLFIVSGEEILSSEETIQGEPTAMGGILLLIKYLLVFVNLKELNAKEAVFVEEFSVAGSLNSIKNYWEKLTAFDPKYDYFPKPAKSY